jgi:putative tryptophan/tyrosine transport system substrate-binding protein
MSEMRRREFFTLLGGAAIAWPLAARAEQSGRVRRIAVLMTSAEDSDGRHRLTAFQKALREHGWLDGANLRTDIRWGAADIGRMRSQVADVLGTRPDAILATSGRLVRVLQEEAREVPVVFVGPVDPVGSGFVKSMARPGGNFTGFTSGETSLAGKWLEILKEAAPELARVALIFGPDNPSAAGVRKLLETAAPSLGVKLIATPIRTASDIESAVEAFSREAQGGLILPLDLTISVHLELVARLAGRYRCPAISGYPGFPAAGGLVSYGFDVADIYRRAASYVDRILRGEKPADLPVQAPTKYELLTNLKTAKALGLEMPPTLLARADEVIE